MHGCFLSSCEVSLAMPDMSGSLGLDDRSDFHNPEVHNSKVIPVIRFFESQFAFYVQDSPMPPVMDSIVRYVCRPKHGYKYNKIDSEILEVLQPHYFFETQTLTSTSTELSFS